MFFFNRFFKLLLLTSVFFALVVGDSLLAEESKSQLKVEKNIKPKLVLLLVIDQFAYDYVERLTPSLKGGLKYIIQNGAAVTQAFHPFANTETCPGHAAISSGYYPSKTGIVANNWFSRESRKEEYCVSDDKFGFSPRKNLKSSLGDWLKEDSDKSLVYSVSGKDRAAIMLGGKKADGVFWYDKNSGDMVSSPYYPKTPSWLKEFNQRKVLNLLFGQTWTPLPASPEEYRFARIEQLNDGDFKYEFPHVLGSLSTYPDAAFYSSVYETPFLDELTVLLTQELLQRTELGRDDRPDLLAVSFSAVDIVGHRFGPNSKEIYDTFKRLDLSLESLLKEVEAKVGLKNTLIVLTGDHGVLPLPEYSNRYGSKHRRVSAADISCIQKQSKLTTDQLQIDNLFLDSFYFNPAIAGLPNIKAKEVIAAFAKSLKSCDFVAEVWTEDKLFADLKGQNPFQLLYQRSFYKERSPDIFIQPKEGFLITPYRGTTHGTPYTYDAHVPLFFVGPTIHKGIVDSSLEITAVAPAIARILGKRYPKDVDIVKSELDRLVLNLIGQEID
jgi:predicted AlkP superfamily pyrophosphatase or phosphodiesterase